MRETHVITNQKLPATLNVVGEKVTVLAGGDSSKPFEVHLQEGKAGDGPPPHNHPWDEAFYVLEGQVELIIDGESTLLDQGSYVHIPANKSHAYRNVSPVTKLLAIVSDCRGGQFFAAADENVKSMPDDIEKLLDVGRKYDLKFDLPGPPV
jgi:quercetin dioxygenase-like cupin family protein